MEFTLMGEVFNIRTDHIDKVERFGDSLKITYLDGNSDTWSANNSYQLPKINTLEIILRALKIGYTQGRNDLYDEDRVITKETRKKLDIYDEVMEELEPSKYKEYHEFKEDDYFPCSSDSCEDCGPGGYSPVD